MKKLVLLLLLCGCLQTSENDCLGFSIAEENQTHYDIIQCITENIDVLDCNEFSGDVKIHCIALQNKDTGHCVQEKTYLKQRCQQAIMNSKDYTFGTTDCEQFMGEQKQWCIAYEATQEKHCMQLNE